MASVTKILVATDFSEHAERAMVLAMDIARGLGATVTVVHAYEIPVYSVPDATLIPPPIYATGIANAAQTCLDTAVERFSDKGVEVTGLLREGPAAREIATSADELDVGMIVIGTHGRSGIARAILGSVAERVMRTAHRPVLAVPPPKSSLLRLLEVADPLHLQRPPFGLRQHWRVGEDAAASGPRRAH